MKTYSNSESPLDSITPETFLRYKFVNNPKLSPKGDYTGFIVQTCNPDLEGYLGNLYVVQHQSGKITQLTHQGDVKDFSWTRDGDLVFPCPRGDDYAQAKHECRPYTVYFRVSPQGGQAERFGALPVDAGAPKILEDGRWVVSSTVDLNKPDFDSLSPDARERACEEYKNPHHHCFEELPMWWNGRGYISRRRNTVFLCDPTKGDAIPVTPRFYDVKSFDCGFGKILYNGSEYDVMYDYYRGLNVYDIATGETRCLIKQGTYQVTNPLVLDAHTALVCLEPKDVYDYVYGDFYTVNLDTGELTKLADYDRIVGANTINTDSKLGGGQTMKLSDGKVYFITTEDEGSYLRFIDRQGKVSPRLSEDGSLDSFDVSDGHIVFCGMRGNLLNELYTLEDGEERRLTYFNRFLQERYSLSVPIPQNFEKDGWEIRGYVMPPTKYVPGQSYPAILHVHGGPKTAFGSTFHHEMQVWANAGYFVLLCNPRGSDGRGEAFADLRGVMGGIDYEDLMRFTDVCLDTWKDIDPDRLGVAGGSYGGFMVNWIIGHTHRFAAAVSQRSICNMISQEFISDEGTGFSLTQYGCTVKDNAKKLWEMSPLKYAHTAVTPTLFIHSDEDYRCPVSEGYQMFAALRREGVDSKLVLFHKEEHGLSRLGRPRNRLTRLNEILNWFERHLK